MHGALAETIAVVLLVLSLAFAVARPYGLSELAAAGPAALVCVLTGIVTAHQAWDRIEAIGPTVGFLAAILVFGHLCADAGVFDHLGAVAARASGGRPTRLLVLVVGLAAGVTATLTLDATVVLLTPVVLVTAARLDLGARPFAYACARVANSGSLLLPVSNLTNLLAFSASGLSFGRFAGLMLMPWALAAAGEWLALRTFFRADLRDQARAVPGPGAPPRYALAVLGVTVALFVVSSYADIAPAWAALAGCVALLLPRLRRLRPADARALWAAASPGFCLFVLALAIVVDAVTRHGLASGLRHLVPSGSSFGALLALSFVAAALANVLNNLPATLALVPLVAGAPGPVLAVLLGVNIGPNLAYPGSLATLLWRRRLPERDKPKAREFHLLGALTVPPLLVVTVGALWAALQVG